MEVETKGPISMKTEKRKNKASYGDGDINEQELEEALKADKKKKRKATDDDYETKKLKSDSVFQIADNQSLNKQSKNSAKYQQVRTNQKNDLFGNILK